MLELYSFHLVRHEAKNGATSLAIRSTVYRALPTLVFLFEILSDELVGSSAGTEISCSGHTSYEIYPAVDDASTTGHLIHSVVTRACGNVWLMYAILLKVYNLYLPIALYGRLY